MRKFISKTTFTLILSLMVIMGSNGLNSYSVLAAERINETQDSDENEPIDITYEYINVSDLLSGKARSSYMQIEGADLSFDSDWERCYYLYCETDDAIVGDLIYGYNKSTNTLYCKTYSYLYTHSAEIQIGSNFYQSNSALKTKWAQKNITHKSSHVSLLHVFGIEITNPETGVSYYLGVAAQ